MLVLEREAELAVVAAEADAARAGRGSLVLVRGAAGIGKTTLLELAVAHAGDIRRLQASGGELERAFVFGVVRQLFESLLRGASLERRHELFAGAAAGAASLFGMEASAASAVGERGAVEYALFWLLANLVEEGPALVVVDDAQWADAASARWLAFLARRVQDLPVAVLVAVRSGERTQAPEALDAIERVASRCMQLEPLSVAATGRLLAAESRSRPRMLSCSRASAPAAAIRSWSWRSPPRCVRRLNRWSQTQS